MNKDFLAGLGKINVQFSSLELALSMLVWGLICDDQNVGQIITADLSFKHIINLLNALLIYKVKDNILYEKSKEIIKRAIQCEEKRNQLTHSIWSINENNDLVFRQKTTSKLKKGLTTSYEILDENKINDISIEINSTKIETIKLLHLLTNNGNISKELFSDM